MSDTQTMTTQDRAAEAARYFETADRDPDGGGGRYVRATDDAPEWVRELCRTAHGGMLPDDWRYETTRAAVEWIAENGDDEDQPHEFAESRIDDYTSDRIEWLGSSAYRPDYVDEATEELGHQADGIVDAIGLGQYQEASEVFHAVADFLRELDD